MDALGAFCHTHEVELVTREATGGYEKQPSRGFGNKVFRSAFSTRARCVVFAEGMCVIEKTYSIDAVSFCPISRGPAA